MDRGVDRLGGLSGRPSGRPVSDPPKTPQMGPGLARARNRQILNRVRIEKYTDFDGRRIRELCPSRTRQDLVLFRVLGGTDFRVGFLGVFVSRIRFVEDTSKRMCPKPTSGRLDRSFFFRCPEVGSGILNLTSGHLACANKTLNSYGVQRLV